MYPLLAIHWTARNMSPAKIPSPIKSHLTTFFNANPIQYPASIDPANGTSPDIAVLVVGRTLFVALVVAIAKVSSIFHPLLCGGWLHISQKVVLGAFLR